eukprot:COSAG01_NODE_9877_length_2314_cov_1.590068_3_plen_132_part_00
MLLAAAATFDSSPRGRAKQDDVAAGRGAVVAALASLCRWDVPRRAVQDVRALELGGVRAPCRAGAGALRARPALPTLAHRPSPPPCAPAALSSGWLDDVRRSADQMAVCTGWLAASQRRVESALGHPARQG